MSRKREKSGSRFSELDDLEYRYYKELKDGKVRISGAGKYLRCPYCQGHRRTDYDFSDLERHATRIARESKSASFRDKGRHLGLLRYLDRYGHRKEDTPISTKRSLDVEKSHHDGLKKDVKAAGKTNLRRGATNDRDLLCTTDRATENLDKLVNEDVIMHTAAGADDLVLEPGEISTRAVVSGVTAKSHATNKGDNEPIVWPWMAVVANLPVEKKDGRYVGESGRKLKDMWVSQGYNPTKVHPLWNIRGHSGFAIVEFNKDWEGFKNAMAFEKSFEMDHCGKKDWFLRRDKGDKLYGWLARAEEYQANGLVGKHLKKNGDLKTVSDIQNEVRRKDTSLMCNLACKLDSKAKECEKIKKKISRTEMFMKNIIAQKEEMEQRYNEKMKKMQDSQSHQLRKITEEHERSQAELDAQRVELESREKELRRLEALNECEKKKLDNLKKMNEMAILEQNKADENMLKLAAEQQKQKELLHKKIIELEAKLDQKQALELQIERMRGAIGVMKHMTDEGDVEDKKKLESIEEELKDKEEELVDLESLNQNLIIKERMTNDEVQDGRKQLLLALKDSRANICVKRMGEVDPKPFMNAAKVKYGGEDAWEKASELCSLWEDRLRDSTWHPYKVVMVGDTHKEVLDQNDEKLKELKTDLGDEVYEAVTKALNELNEYNPSGRYPVPELWNTSENRKIPLKEGIAHLLKQWKALKGRRRR